MQTYTFPDESGKYGKFGGRYIPELLMPAVLELEEAYEAAKKRPFFSGGIK